MSMKNILVHYNGTEGATRAVRLAAAMARRYDAHLTGILAHAAPYSLVQMEAYMTQATIAVMQDTARETEEQCAKGFAEIIAQEEQGLRTSFLCLQGFPNDVLARLGRTHDLIVIAQPDGQGSIYNEAFPDDVATRSGRPVLIAPRAFEQFEAAGGAVLAWDGQRAASRALSDAMDLLKDRDAVTVVHVGTEEDIRRPGEDIMEHLSRHGLNASLTVQPPGGVSTSDIILNTCAETDAGLLVMGAYEHPRFSEMLLGGVTRDLVAKSHIPVLMSH